MSQQTDQEIVTLNPATEVTIQRYPILSSDEINERINYTQDAWLDWQKTPIKLRCQQLLQLKTQLLKHKSDYAKLITQEMGKPIHSAHQEIEKCATLCDHYASYGERYLQAEYVKTDTHKKSYVVYKPLGLILGIMPWNFPFWQVFRLLVPNLVLGNGILLKHAPITTGCALAIESIMQSAGFPSDLLSVLIINANQLDTVIAHPYVQGVTLTGSERAGQSVAEKAGRNLKKTVMELGGCDPYLILEDNDDKALEKAAEICVTSRMAVTGQVCISPKRLIVVAPHYATFKHWLKEKLSHYTPSDPLLQSCNLGPLARKDLRHTVHQQVQDSIQKGALCEIGGVLPLGKGFFYPPTLLTQIPKIAPAYYDEIFGPVVSLIQAKNEQQAIGIANSTRYGLGAGIFTQNLERGEQIARDLLNAGTCAVNGRVISDPYFPFGGIRNSGYGRELGVAGIREFSNTKTIHIHI